MLYHCAHFWVLETIMSQPVFSLSRHLRAKTTFHLHALKGQEGHRDAFKCVSRFWQNHPHFFFFYLLCILQQGHVRREICFKNPQNKTQKNNIFCTSRLTLKLCFRLFMVVMCDWQTGLSVFRTSGGRKKRNHKESNTLEQHVLKSSVKKILHLAKKWLNGTFERAALPKTAASQIPYLIWGGERRGGNSVLFPLAQFHISIYWHDQCPRSCGTERWLLISAWIKCFEPGMWWHLNKKQKNPVILNPDLQKKREKKRKAFFISLFSKICAKMLLFRALPDCD